MKRPWPLFAHILVRILPVTLLLLAGVWLAVFSMARETLRKEAEARVRMEAASESRAIDEKLDHLVHLARILAANDLVVNGLIDTIDRKDYLSLFFRSLRIPWHPDFQIALADYKGRPVASNSLRSPSYQGEKWVPTVMEGDEWVEATGERFRIAVPVRYQNLPEGVLVMEAEAEAVWRSWIRQETEHLVLLRDASGRVLYSSAQGPVSGGEGLPVPGPGHIRMEANVDGLPGLFVTVCASVEESFPEALRFQGFLVWALAVMVGSLVAGVALSSHLASRPLKSLLGEIRAIRENFDPEGRVSEPSVREFSRLARAFNGMMKEIERTTVHAVLLREAEEALKRQTEKQRLLLDNIEVQVWYLSDERTYGAVNRAHAEFFSVGKKDLELKDLFEIVNEEEARVCMEGNREVFAKKGSVRNEEWIVNGRGEKRLLTITKTPRLDENGDVEYVVCSAVDHTERWLAEEALRKARDELEERVRERTRELEETQKELVAKALEAGRAQMSAIVLHNIGNAVTPVVALLEQIKESCPRPLHYYLKRCYGDLEAHREELGSYVDKDPKGREVFRYLGELAESLESIEGRREEMFRSIEGAVAYVSEILSIQHAYSASNTEGRQRIRLNAMVRDAIAMQRVSLEKRGVRADTDLQEDLPELLLNPNRFMQVLVNLIKNGYEAMAEDGGKEKKIVFRTFSRNGEVVLQLTDTGVGLEDRQDPSSIFEVGNSGKGSTGFGLYYCKQFLEANEGSLALSSPGKGQGTTVTVKLPARSEQGAKARRE